MRNTERSVTCRPPLRWWTSVTNESAAANLGFGQIWRACTRPSSACSGIARVPSLSAQTCTKILRALGRTRGGETSWVSTAKLWPSISKISSSVPTQRRVGRRGSWSCCVRAPLSAIELLKVMRSPVWRQRDCVASSGLRVDTSNSIGATAVRCRFSF